MTSNLPFSRPRVVDLSTRTQLEITGPDRAAFLHNLCTQEIRKLPPSAGAEAFLLDARGHVLAFVTIYCAAESLILETVPGYGPQLLAHLERYHIREKIELHDRSATWGECLVAGAGAADVLATLTGLAPPAELYAHREATMANCVVSLRNVDWTGEPGWLVSTAHEALVDVQVALTAPSCEPCEDAMFDAARIAAGMPCYGLDITDKTLPQEVARDARAISFTKGCYIGQETVARLDALGHVNKTLTRVRFTGRDVPPAGSELTLDGKPVGTITSAAYWPPFDTAIALAYLRRGANTPGTKLTSAVGPAEVW